MTWTASSAAAKGYYVALGRERDCKVTFWDALANDTRVEIPLLNLPPYVFLCVTALGNSDRDDLPAQNSGLYVAVLRN